MSILNILSCLGGIALFLFGMTYMSDSLKKLAGNQMKNFLTKMTSNPLKGFLVGLALTMAIQSSTASNVMALSFVNTGMMTLTQSIPFMIGANLGTTVTAWLISLSSIDGAGILIQLIKPAAFTPILAFIGILLFRFSKKDKKNSIGAIIVGFAILMYGMSAMSSAMQGLSTTPAFERLFSLMSNPIMGLIIGTAFAAIMQSSSASIGVLQALALAGGITYESVIPMVIGINIGQVVPVLIASAGTSKNARRAAIINLYLNVTGAMVAMPVYMVLRATGHIPFLHALAVPVTIAITHTGYKLLCSTVQLPLYKQFERLGRRTFKDVPSESKSLLDPHLMATPALAMAQCRGVLASASVRVSEAFEKACVLFTSWNKETLEEIHKVEQMTDTYQDEIDTYLAEISVKSMTARDTHELSGLMQYTAQLENIGDHIYHMAVSMNRMNEEGHTFNEHSIQSLNVLSEKMREMLSLSEICFASPSEENSFEIIFAGRNIVNLCDNYRDEYLTKLKSGSSTVAVSSIFSDILQDFERISDHISRQARTALADLHNVRGLEAKKYVADLIEAKASAMPEQI